MPKETSVSELDFIRKQLSSIQDQLKLLTSIQMRVNSIEDEIKSIKASQDFISNQFDSQSEINSKVENDLKELRTQNENMVNHLQESTDEIVFLKNQINDLEQYGRRDMVEIHGIERKENEDTNNLVLKIAKKVYRHF